MPEYKLPSEITTEFEALQWYAFNRCPHTREQFINEYWSEYQAALSCIGQDLAESTIPGQNIPGLYNHSLLSLDVAAYSIKHIRENEAVCKAWIDGELTRGETDHRFPFSRAVWRYAVTAHIGYIVSNYAIFKPGTPFTWRPILHNLYEFCPRPQALLVPSNRTLDPRVISLMTYARLFSHCPDYHLTISAVTDAFAASPSPDNPVSESFVHALSYLEQNLRNSTLPYWWVDLINDYMKLRDDFVPIRYNAQGVDIFSKVAKNPDAILEFLSECIVSGKLTVSRKKATFHVLEGRLYMVVPAGWQRLAALFDHPTMDAEKLEQIFNSNQFIVNDPVSEQLVSTWNIKPAHSTTIAGHARCVLFSEEATNIIFSGGIQQPDNPDFIRAESASLQAV